MKFALGEVRQLKEPVASLLAKELPIKVAWRLTKLVKAFDRELMSIEEARISLVKKYGEASEEGITKVPDASMGDFVEEFNAFLSEEVEIEFEPIPVDLFGDVTLSTRDLMFLEKLLV